MPGREQVPFIDKESTMSKHRKVELSPIATSVTGFRKALKDNPIFRTCVVVVDQYAVMFVKKND